MKLSENFSLNELTKSQTATRRGISNQPSEEHLENLKDIKDSKSILQEILQKKGIDVPVYKLRTISSKDEEISFEAKVYCNNKLLATADGKRKSIAEQKAAEKAIFNLKNSL